MIHRALIAAALALSANAATAACYADYKAKQDNPLRLHYGVIELRGDCALDAAAEEIEDRLDGTGWQLLSVTSVFEEDGLEERRADAADYYLRF